MFFVNFNIIIQGFLKNHKLTGTGGLSKINLHRVNHNLELLYHLSYKKMQRICHTANSERRVSKKNKDLKSYLKYDIR